MIIHDSLGNAIDSFPLDDTGKRTIPVSMRGNVVETVIEVQNLAATQSFIVISLGNTTQWKHTATNLIHVDRFGININPSSSYRGDIDIGFISNSSATKADFNILKTYHNDQAASQIAVYLNLLGMSWICDKNHWFGPTVSGDTSFGNSIGLIGPDGYTHFGQYNGDLVMKVSRTAGNVDVGVVIGYHTT